MRVHDAGARRMHAHTLQRACRPFHEAVALAVAREFGSMFNAMASAVPNSSTAIEWSTDTSTGNTGLSTRGIAAGFGQRIAHAGDVDQRRPQVVSCISTREG